MKRTIFFLTAAALVFAACQKEQSSPVNAEGLQFTATVEQQSCGDDTKTSLGNDLNVLWSTGDQINVFTDASTPEKLTLALISGAGTTAGGFKTSEEPDGNPQYAIYPAADGNSISGSNITFTLPATQTYAANTFANGANVAVGIVSGTGIEFKNVCGVFKLTIYGNYTVSKIELSGKSDEKLNGEYTVAASSYTCTCTTTSTASEKTITLNCGTDGVTLSPTTATTFNFVVPVGAFVNGFVAKVYNKTPSLTGYDNYELSTTSANSIVRSRVKAMPANTIVDPCWQKVEYLEDNDSTSVHFFDTGIVPDSTTVVEVKFEIPNTLTANYDLLGSRTCESGAWTDFFHVLLQISDASSYINCVRFVCGTTGNNYTPNNSLENPGTHILKAENNKITLDGTEYAFETHTFPGQSTRSLYLFALNNNGSTTNYSAAMRIHYAKIIQNNTCVKYYIPVIRKYDNRTGFYDLMYDSPAFYGNNYYAAGPTITY